MGTIILTDQTLKYIALFEGVTKASVKDCLEYNEMLYFIVENHQLKKAIGKNGSNIRQLRKLFHKNIKIIEYSPKIEDFIKSIFHGFSIKNITIQDGDDGKKQVAYVHVDIRDKGKVIGLESKNLKIAREIINRYTPMDILIV